MININLNVKNVKELKTMLAYLRAEGLIKTNNVEKEEPLLSRSPRATKAEMDIRQKIDRQRINSGERPIDWKNFAQRKRALKDAGFVIGMTEIPDPDEGGAVFDGQVSLDNVT